jgi:hypothetical protein
MKRLIYAITVTMLFAGAAGAQDQPEANAPRDSAYYLDRETAARAAIQRRAAWKAAQRQARIEMNKWYGYSPLRPPATIVPMMGSSTPWMGRVVFYPYAGTFFPRVGY